MGAIVDRHDLLTSLETLPPVSIGIDIGQISDPTAICVTEVQRTPTGRFRYDVPPVPAYYDERSKQWIPPKDAEPVMVTEYIVRYIQRLPLGMSYPDVAVHIADMLCNPMLGYRKIHVLMDVTGVGRPVYDDLRLEIKLREEARGVILKPVNFVHGERYNPHTGSLGKAFLVSRLQSLLQGRRVHAPDTSEVNATLEELKVYEIKVSQDGTDTYGASTGKHDDLATAMALSVLEDPFAYMVTYSKRVY